MKPVLGYIRKFLFNGICTTALIFQFLQTNCQNGGHAIDFRVGRLASGYQDLKMNSYGIGYNLYLLKKLSLTTSFNHSTGELRNYYGLFLGNYADTEYTADNFSGHIFIKPDKLNESELWYAYADKGNIGYGKNIPPTLLANIYNLKFGLEYQVYKIKKSVITLNFSGNYVYQRLMYEAVAGNWTIINPNGDLPGQNQTINTYLKLNAYERQNIFGVSLGLGYWYNVSENFRLGCSIDLSNLKTISTFSHIHLVGRCYL